MNRSLAFFLFRLVVSSLVLIVQWYLYRRSSSFLITTERSTRWGVRALSVLFLLFNSPLVVLLFYRVSFTEFSPLFLYCAVFPFYVWHGATFFIFLVLGVLRILQLPVDLLLRFGKANQPLHQKLTTMRSVAIFREFDRTRRAFLRSSAVLLSGYSFVGATRGIIDRNDYDIVERAVHIADLPDEFKGFTIGLMSDIHSSVFMTKPEMDDYVVALNGLKTDIIFVPGDFVNSQTEEVYPFAEAFSALRAPYGVFGCLGNHDYFADVDVVAREVDGCGVKLLRNDSVTIRKGSSSINVLGIDDIPMNGKAETYLERALATVRDTSPKILLCHKPYFLETIAARNIDLTLAGHTHGGQVVFARIGNSYITPASLFSKYVWGLYKFNQSQMYVTRGIGTIGVPFRINCPPEITKITLT